MFENIVWSTKSCSLKTFVGTYPLPQLVQVENGFYSEDEANTLSAGQILTLHCTKLTDQVLAIAAADKPYFIPVNFPCKVQILPTICEDRYYSVKDIVDASCIKFIRVVHNGPPWGIRAGDILKLKKTVQVNRQTFIECEFNDKTRGLVRLPLEFKAAFEPLDRSEEYHFQEVLNSFKLPVRVKFTSSDTTIQDVNGNQIDLLSLDSVLLQAVQEESKIIATSRDDNVVSVLMIPTDLNVSLRPALGTLTGDKTYVRFCRDIHDGADLKKVDLSLARVSRLPGDLDVTMLYDYVEMKPIVPPRYTVSPQPESSIDCSNSSEYEEVLPPRPPKSPKWTSSPPAQQQFDAVSKGFNENAPNWEDNQGPPIPPRTASLQQSNLKTVESDTDDNDDGIEFCENSPNFVDGQTPIPPDRTEVKLKTADNSTLENATALPKYLLCPSPGARDPGNEIVEKDDGMESCENLPNCVGDHILIHARKEANLNREANGADDKDDDYDHDWYLDSDAWGYDYDSDYSYPDLPDPNRKKDSNAPQGSPELGKRHSLRERISGLFSRAIPKSPRAAESPSVPSQVICSINISDKHPIETSTCNTASTSLSTSLSKPSDRRISKLNFPDDLSCLSVPEVGECLRKLNMENYVDTFESNQIDGQLFLTLDEELLSSLGVNDAFGQKKLTMFIHGWRPKTS